MPPEFQRLENPDAGSIGMAAWLNVDDNVAPVGFNQNVLVPSQDMGRFQRRFADVIWPSQIVALNDVVTFRIQVPIDNPIAEQWRVVWISIKHNDPGGAMSWTVNVAHPGGGKFVVIDHPVAGPNEFLLYPGRVTQPASGTSSQWDLQRELELLPNDILTIITGTFTGAATVFCQMRVEKVPPILRFEKLRDQTTTKSP